MPPYPPDKDRRGASAPGFSLVEMLVSIAVLSVILLILVTLSGQTQQTWSAGERQNQVRLKTRAALEYIARDLKQAVLPPDPAKVKRQFVVNPSLPAAYLNRDAVFWQAPIAVDDYAGALAEVGYFVEWDAKGQANLCRFFVTPSDSDYKAYTAPDAWVTGAIVASSAPIDNAGHYRGLFLENVLGIWVKAYKADGSAYGPDSSSSRKLPAYVEVSLVFLDSANARRLSASGLAAAVRGLYGKSADARAFASTLPGFLQNQAGVASIRVAMDNYR